MRQEFGLYRLLMSVSPAMTFWAPSITYAQLEGIRGQLISELVPALTEPERKFLVSIKQGTPEWNLLGIPGIENLPALQWKLANIRKMDTAGRGCPTGS
jgi:hypothetical protein